MATISTGSARPAETGPQKAIFSSPPLLDIPPRSFTDAFAKVSDLATLTPMSFVSCLFVEQDPCAECKSLSQLLGGTSLADQQKIESPEIQRPGYVHILQFRYCVMPRSYYKCTNLGCSVRKHVERSAIDSKAVITTDEGKHNHDVPVARSSHRDINENATSVLPAPSLLGSSALVMQPMLAVSLQEQVFGKFGGIDPTVQDQIDSKMEPEAEYSNMSWSSNMRSLGEGSNFLYQGAGMMKPKKEPEVVGRPGSFLQPMYHRNTSPLVAQKLLL